MATPCPVSYGVGSNVIILGPDHFLGFWQYGLINWELFHSCLRTIIFSSDDWAVFWYDEDAPGKRGPFCPPGHDLPNPETYVLLHPGICGNIFFSAFSFFQFLCYRRHSDLCGFDTPFGSTSPSNY
jgi:hypothetical protein